MKHFRKVKMDKLLTAFILENKESMYRIAYSYVKNKEDALDIVQDSIHKALLMIDSLKDPEAIKSWFYRIVVNTSLDFLRKHRRVSIVDSETMELMSPKEVDHYQNLDLERALEQLPIKYRSVIILRYFEDLKIEEVAEILQDKTNTVKTRLYRALEMLRIEMTEEEKDNE